MKFAWYAMQNHIVHASQQILLFWAFSTHIMLRKTGDSVLIWGWGGVWLLSKYDLAWGID